MITLTIQDAQDIISFDTILSSPIILTPIINETDVETIDGNISTYYGSTKRQYQFKIAWLDATTYAKIIGFRDRQYANLKYPRISITGATNINVSDMVAKITVSEQEVVDKCGTVENVVLTFRESKQMP